MISAKDIPHFTGDLERLEQHASGLRAHADALRQAGSVAHSKFQGLGAFYHAPEAERLFASTAPVRDRADLFASKVETVAGALDDYAGAVRPIIARLDHLRTRVVDFAASLKTDSGEIDDEWTQDQDKIDQHAALWSEVGRAQADFTAAETAANNKITALVDGTQYVPQGYEGTLVPRGAQVYGYTADALKHADKLPWGTPEALTYDTFDLSHHVEEAGVGFTDAAVGTVTGLVDLVSIGPDGDAARKGLGMTFLGLESYLFDPLNKQDSPWKKQVAEGRPYTKAFAKSLVAWDEWQDNKGKAAGTVIFNGMTLASGPLAVVSKLAKGGAVAKTAGTIAKVGEAIDPLSATVKAVGATTRAVPKIADVTARARAGFGNAPGTGSTSTVLRVSATTELHLINGEFVILKNGIPDTTPAPVERTPSVEAPREHQLIGAGARTPEAGAHAGENLPPQASHEPPAGKGQAGSPQGNGHNEVGGSAGSRGNDWPSPTGAVGGGGAGDAPGPRRSGGSGSDGLPGRGADEALPTGKGWYDQLDPHQIKDVQVYRANHEPGYRKSYYQKNGQRLRVAIPDESGFAPPQLAKDPHHPGMWVAASDKASPIPEKYVPGSKVERGPGTVRTPQDLDTISGRAHQRHASVTADNVWHDPVKDAKATYKADPTPENRQAYVDIKAEHAPFHTAMSKDSEAFGEAVARHHVIPEHYAGAQMEELAGPKNGNDQFDQLWSYTDKSGKKKFVVIESKSSTTTDLGKRELPSGFDARQGSKEYFLDIMREMKQRGLNGNTNEKRLYKELSKALKQGNVEYILVKGKVTSTGEYAGYQKWAFDIS